MTIALAMGRTALEETTVIVEITFLNIFSSFELIGDTFS